MLARVLLSALALFWHLSYSAPIVPSDADRPLPQIGDGTVCLEGTLALTCSAHSTTFVAALRRLRLQSLLAEGGAATWRNLHTGSSQVARSPDPLASWRQLARSRPTDSDIDPDTPR